MRAFLMTLEAREPARNVFRNYEITAGRDLFGAWIVDVRYGRIGAPGRVLRQSFGDEAAACRRALDCLRQRQSAPRRIGVPYVVMRLEDECGWLQKTKKPACSPFSVAQSEKEHACRY